VEARRVSQYQIDFKVMMVKSTPLPDGTTLWDLLQRPDIGQEEACAAFEAALRNSRDACELSFEAVKVFAEAHGYDPQEAFYEAFYRQLEVMSTGLPVTHH
jgi:hypothetical protein